MIREAYVLTKVAVFSVARQVRTCFPEHSQNISVLGHVTLRFRARRTTKLYFHGLKRCLFAARDFPQLDIASKQTRRRKSDIRGVSLVFHKFS